MTSYIVIDIDGKRVPLKVGGYEGKKEGKIQYTIAELRAGDPNLKKRVLEESASDVQNAYQIFVPKPFAGNFERIMEKEKKVDVIMPNGSRREIKIKKLTRLGKKGAKRAWLEGRPFEGISKDTAEDMVKQGSSMVGILFSELETASEYTLKRTERKEKTELICPQSKKYPGRKISCYERSVVQRYPSIRGGSEQLNIINQRLRNIREGETKEEVYRVDEDGRVYALIDKSKVKSSTVKPSNYRLEELHYTNIQGEKVDRPAQLVQRRGYKRGSHPRKQFWKQVGTIA